MTTRTTPMTAEELLQMPDDGFRYELVRGELRKIPPAGHVHGWITASLAGPLIVHVKGNNLGKVYIAEAGFKLACNPDHVRAPDVAFIRRERVEEVGDTAGFWSGASGLVVEVISPSDTYAEVQERVFDWLEARTRMVVLANYSGRSVTVYRSLTDVVVLTENDTLDGEDVVPGWKLPVKEIFT